VASDIHLAARAIDSRDQRAMEDRVPASQDWAHRYDEVDGPVSVRVHDAVDLPESTVLCDHLVAFPRGADLFGAAHPVRVANRDLDGSWACRGRVCVL